MSIFEFTDYKAYLRQRIALLPQKGRGESLRMASALSIHPTLVSQILKGDKDFTLEQGQALCDYFGLIGLEADYFLVLIQIERAGTKSLKDYFKSKRDEIKRASKEVAQRVAQDRKLTDMEKARFYSDWIYSAIRLQTSIPGYQSVDQLAEHFALPRQKVNEILMFLVSCGLCVENQGGYELGAQRTYLEQGSPYLNQHYQNWRLKALERSRRLTSEELMFSSPMTLSQADFQHFRESLVEFIKHAFERVKTSDAEKLACMNIDWFFVER